MNEEQILSTLGEAEKAAQTIPERWRRLAEGQASASEVALLEAEASRDTQAALLLARFRPLESADEDLIAGAMMAQRQRARSASPSWWMAAGAAAAAAAFAWVGLPHEPPLPGYALEAATPDLGYRGAQGSPDSVPKHHVSSALSLIMRPSTPVTTPLAVQTFVIVGDRAMELDAAWELSAAGAARLDGVVSNLLPGHSGSLTLVGLVRSAGHAPISSQAAWRAQQEGSPPSGTRWVLYPMYVVTD